MTDENENESLDINDYSIEELKDLFDISTLTPVNIDEKINESIEQFNEEGNNAMITFFE